MIVAQEPEGPAFIRSAPTLNSISPVATPKKTDQYHLAPHSAFCARVSGGIQG
jgi:hypothetical protein